MNVAGLRPNRAELIDGGALWVLVTIGLYSFRSSYGGIEFVVVGALAALLGVVSAIVCVRRRWPVVVQAAAVGASYVVLGAALGFRDRNIAGFVPTPTTLATTARMAVTGWKALITTRPPVGSVGGLLVLPVLAGLVAGSAGVAMARRMRQPILALVAPTAVLVVGIAAGLPRPVSVVVHGSVFLVGALAWLVWREQTRRALLAGSRQMRRQLAMATGMLAVAGALAVPAAPHLPLAASSARAIWRTTVTPPFDPRQYPSPLAGYRTYVKSPPKTKSGQAVPVAEDTSQQPMFTVSGLPKGVPVRLATMDTYDGLVWQVSGGDPNHPSLDDSGSFERVGSELAPDVTGPEATVTVTIGKYNDVWVPSVGEVLSLRFTGSAGGPQRDRKLNDALRYNRATDTAAAPPILAEGDRYVMRVRLPYELPNLAGVPLEPSVAHLGPASQFSQLVTLFAGPELLADNDDGSRLDHVRDLFVHDGTYSDGDKDAGQLQARAGHDIERLAEFVQGYPKQPLVGNAEQYASAYALLFRQVNNLPTRVVMGFVPPQESTAGPVTVIGRQVEAWVEVPVKGKGWVAIMPTPKRDQTAKTTAAPQQPDPDYRTQTPPPPPVLDPEFDNPATAAGKAKSTKKNTDDPSKQARTPTPSVFANKVVVGTAVGSSPFVVFAVVSVVIVALKARRRRKRRMTGEGHVRIANGWHEITDLAIDMGRPVPSTTTRREAAGFVGGDTVALAVKADAAVWAGSEPTEAEVEQYWEELVGTLKSMRSELGLLARVRTAINVRSLRRREHSGLPGSDRTSS